MRGICLLNHRSHSYEPFKSIMRLPRKEAFALAAKLFEDKTCTANSRFESEKFSNYYELRLRAEERLYNKFIAHGGKPQEKHPLYFYVHGWDLSKKFWADSVTERLELDNIETCDISFTFGDSYKEVNNPDKSHFFMKDELMQLIAKHGGIEELIAHVKSLLGYGMIEAQLWNDRYVVR